MHLAVPQSVFGSDDLAKLTSVVQSRANAALRPEDYEDIVAEILLSAWITASRAGATAPFRAIAFRYARHPSYYVTARSRKATPEYDPAEHEWDIADTADPTLSVEIRMTLARLDAGARKIIWLCDVEGLTLAETATQLGISTASAHRRLARAHKNFKAAWTGA